MRFDGVPVKQTFSEASLFSFDIRKLPQWEPSQVPVEVQADQSEYGGFLV